MRDNNLFYSQGTDLELFLLVKQNDGKAFEEIYNRYWPNLVNIAYKRLDTKERAEDIVQNIFIDIYQRRSTINLANSLNAYLSQALKFQLLNEYRSNAIRAKYQEYFFSSLRFKVDVNNPLEAKDLEIKIHSVVDGLPEKCKRVFLLSRNNNLSNRNIAETLNISVCTVEKHIGKALKTLKSQIQNYN